MTRRGGLLMPSSSGSPFVRHFTQPLAVSPRISRPPTPAITTSSNPQQKETLQNFYASLGPSPTREAIQDVANSFLRIQPSNFSTGPADSEETVLRNLVVTKLVTGLYSQALELYLSEAVDAENEAEWWAEIERSRWNLAYYLVQTLPSRFISLTGTILLGFRTHDVPLQMSNLTPSNLRRLFPSSDAFHPSQLVTSLFPHLQKEKNPYQLTPLTMLFVSPAAKLEVKQQTLLHRIRYALSSITRQVTMLFLWPLELTRQEVKRKRKELEKIRDARAEALGAVAQMRTNLEQALQESDGNLSSVVDSLERVIGGPQRASDAYLPSPSETPGVQHPTSEDPWSLVSKVSSLSGQTIPSHIDSHETEVETEQLRRPNRLTLIWPKLLIVPPLTLYGIYAAYASRNDLQNFYKDARETVQGFTKGWIVEPVKDVLRTVRAGSAQSIIIQEEAIKSDVDSLERMVIALAQEKLHYPPDKLDELSQRIRVGDLTPVLKLYEEDIKSPLKSTVRGTLLRTLFVQVQKAKVDIDQALAGIDKLLKSQELTFAFVGIAPAFGIVYLTAKYVSSVWQGGRGRGKLGGRDRRGHAWSAIRRIERLLVSQPTSSSSGFSHYRQLPRSPVSTIANVGEVPIYPITAGLLLLSVARLREYGEVYLPPNSRLKQGFLEDLGDLEEPTLTRDEKLRVVERMWRSWGGLLGWTDMGNTPLR